MKGEGTFLEYELPKVYNISRQEIEKKCIE